MPLSGPNPAPGESIRVVVRLPFNRPEDAVPNPPQIEWTPEKADILWKVIERSRSTDSGGADWKGLAAHLEVPLPYLLYRVNARFQEEIRGLKDIQDILSPTSAQGAPPPSPFSPTMDGPSQVKSLDKGSALQKIQTRMNTSGGLGASTMSKLNTPLGVRARLNSLTKNSTAYAARSMPERKNSASSSAQGQSQPAISSSTLTLQASNRDRQAHQPHSERRVPEYRNTRRRPSTSYGYKHGGQSPRSPSPASSNGTDSSDEYALKEEEAERLAEEQDLLAKKLEELQKMISSDAIGLVSRPPPPPRQSSSSRPRRRSLNMLSPRSAGSMTSSSIPNLRQGGYDTQSLSTRSGRDSLNQSSRNSVTSSAVASSAGSPQGSIPDIPSPNDVSRDGSQPHSPIGYSGGRPGYGLGRGVAAVGVGATSNPPIVSRRSATGSVNGNRQTSRNGRQPQSDEYMSSHGSEASSFSDLSDASLSASALESALMSNIRGNGSRFSQFAPSTRSRLPPR
ncbi:hypothetical protein BKA70DRAFT_1256754 [Coprinopsis sp. MPI-PUGE-AT-0042]|nr:hypothetical protein BKA70DRAFT_1256754 [Coprinopsis sp. MPI-PUGE-AT-0042]